MLFRLVVASLSVLSVTLVCNTSLSAILNSAELKAFFESVIAAINGIWSGNTAFDGSVQSAYEDLLALVSSNVSSITGAIIATAIIIYVENFLLGISHFALTKIVNEHMSSLTKVGFFEAIFSSLKSAAPFEALYALCKIAAVAATLFISGLFASLAAEVLSFYSIIIAIWMAIFILSVLLTVTVKFRPCAVNGSPIRYAVLSASAKKFWTVCGSNVLTVTVWLVINIVFFLTTFGAGLMISLPLTALFFACLKLVAYYNLTDKKYYIDIDTIVTPVILREDGELLDKVDVQ